MRKGRIQGGTSFLFFVVNLRAICGFKYQVQQLANTPCRGAFLGYKELVLNWHVTQRSTLDSRIDITFTSLAADEPSSI